MENKSRIEQLEALVEKLTAENNKLKSELEELAYLREKSQTQALELESQNDELVTARYELELQNEELLRSKSEIEQLLNKFNTLFNLAPIGFILLNNEFEIVEVNKSFADLISLLPEQILNKKVEEILGFKIIDIIKNYKTYKSQPEQIVIDITKTNKQKVFLRVDLRILDNVFENKRHYLLSLLDISEARNYQLQLQKSEEKFRSIFEQIPVGIYRSTPAGRIIMANPKLVSMLGYNSVEELYNLDLESQDYPLQEGRSRFKQIMEEVGEMIGAKEVWFQKSGNSIIVRESARAVRDETGNIVYYEGVVEDITEEEYLKEQIDAIIRTIPDVLIHMDEDGRYLDVFTSNVSLLVAPKEETLNKTLHDLFPKDLADYFLKSIRTAINENRTILISYDLDTLQGKKSFEASITPLHAKHSSGKKTVVTLARDVTDRKQIELDLVKSNYEKDLYFSIIGYDLREPITSMITTADIFTNYYDKLEPDQIKKYIFQLSEEIYVLKNLIDNLLDWSKSQTGKLEFNPEITDLYNLIENAILVYKNQASSKDIRIISNVQPKTYAQCDRFMISSVLRNLLSNALKYSYPHTVVEIDISTKNYYYYISVKDHGQGIPPDKLQHIFEDNELFILGFNKRRIPGLGLHICKSFIEKHNGEITVESKFGEGSTFTFSVPIADLTNI